MPVYYRTDVAMTPSSINNVIPEDDDDYIQDPDQLRDQLPQPFRLVDKILTSVIDDAWDIIQNRENKRIADSSKIRPPQYECGIQLHTHGNASAMVDSKDGKYIFLGQPDGLAVIDAANQQTVTVWEAPDVAIETIHVSMMCEESYLLSTIDQNGNARLFGLNNAKLYLLQSLNEKDPESSSRKIATRCEASFDADYVGVSLQSAGSSSCIFEVYKVPKEAWLKDFGSLHNQATKKQSRLQSPHHQTETDDVEAAAEDTQPVEDAVSNETAQEQEDPDEARSGSPGSHRAASASGDRSSHKFTPGHVILKVKSPEPITGIQTSSPYAASKGITQGDVIGTGANHLITAHHLEQREATFNHAHAQLIRYLPTEAQEEKIEPTFHFLTAGRMLPYGLEQTALNGHTTSVAVWWSKGTQISHYSLVKQAKELEHKAEMVWPFASRIAASAVSPCTNLVAVALHSGNMLIWDKYIGLQRKILHVTKRASITSVEFLDPRLYPQEDITYPPYRTSTAGYVMVTCDDGSVMLVNCGQDDRSGPAMASPELETEEEMYSKLITIPGIPQLILTCRQNGCVYIQDIIRGSILCQITLPVDHTLSTPLHPVMAVGANGEMLYMKAECTAPKQSRKPSATEVPAETVDEETGDVSPTPAEAETQGVLFAFQLRSFPSLDRYRQEDTQPLSYTVHPVISDRIDALLKERLTQQVLRKPRMQERWNNLKNDLEMIKQIREKKPSLGRKAFTHSSIARTPILNTKKPRGPRRQ